MGRYTVASFFCNLSLDSYEKLVSGSNILQLRFILRHEGVVTWCGICSHILRIQKPPPFGPVLFPLIYFTNLCYKSIYIVQRSIISFISLIDAQIIIRRVVLISSSSIVSSSLIYLLVSSIAYE